MSKAKKTPPKVKNQLTVEERHALHAAELESARTAADQRAATWFLQLTRTAHELAGYKQREMRQKEEQEAADRLTQAKAAADEAKEQQRKMAMSIAEAYAVDLSKTAFDPLTGLLLPLPEDAV